MLPLLFTLVANFGQFLPKKKLKSIIVLLIYKGRCKWNSTYVLRNATKHLTVIVWFRLLDVYSFKVKTSALKMMEKAEGRNNIPEVFLKTSEKMLSVWRRHPFYVLLDSWQKLVEFQPIIKQWYLYLPWLLLHVLNVMWTCKILYLCRSKVSVNGCNNSFISFNKDTHICHFSN